jgi:hypothetical protein
LAKPPLLLEAVPPPVPPDCADVAFAAPVDVLPLPIVLLLAAVPPPVPAALPVVAFGAGCTLA